MYAALGVLALALGGALAWGLGAGDEAALPELAAPTAPTALSRSPATSPAEEAEARGEPSGAPPSSPEDQRSAPVPSAQGSAEPSSGQRKAAPSSSDEVAAKPAPVTSARPKRRPAERPSVSTPPKDELGY
jgi:hypothetical protein